MPKTKFNVIVGSTVRYSEKIVLKIDVLYLMSFIFELIH